MDELKSFAIIISYGGGAAVVVVYIFKILKLFTDKKKNGDGKPSVPGEIVASSLLERGISIGVQVAENATKTTMLLEQMNLLYIENGRKLDQLLDKTGYVLGNQEAIKAMLDAVQFNQPHGH